MPEPREMRSSEYGVLVLLAAVWGLSYALYRVGSPALGPALFVELRVAVAAAVLIGYVAARGGLRPMGLRLRENARPLVVVGALNAALPFTFISVGELHLAASYASVLNATTPFFSTILSAPLLGQPIRTRHLLGVAAGIGGVALLVGTAPFPLTGLAVLSMVLILAAALSYGIAGIFVKRQLPRVAPLDLSVGQQIVATVLLVPLAVPELPSAQFTAPAILSVLALALFSTALAYGLYFRLVQSAGPRSAASVTFLIPVFGILWSAGLLGEPIGAGILAAAGLTIVGVLLLTDFRRSTPVVKTAGPEDGPPR